MEKYSYKNSGVHLKNSFLLTEMLSDSLKSANFTNFAGILNIRPFVNIFLAATTDGIGTKIIPLIERKLYKTIAIDLAAMNLNDLACVGAKPLFFLDYIAANVLNPKEISDFILELHTVLKAHDCKLIGGETSEVGNFIQKETFDAAGFAVGLVKKENLITKNNVKENDVIIALKSNGLHSNGFSLVRRLFADKKFGEKEYLKALEPTLIYSDMILKLCEKGLVSGLSNITGGGILSNLERSIPDGLMAKLAKDSLPKMEIFEILNKFVDEDEMFQTFNMGAGFCIIAKQEYVSEILNLAKEYSPFIFGIVKKACNGTKAEF